MTTLFAATPLPLSPSETAASCQSPDSEEADGTPIVFSPANVLDHTRQQSGAMRRRRSNVADVRFDAPTRLTSVGLIGGYVKVDRLTGVDRSCRTIVYVRCGGHSTGQPPSRKTSPTRARCTR